MDVCAHISAIIEFEREREREGIKNGEMVNDCERMLTDDYVSGQYIAMMMIVMVAMKWRGPETMSARQSKGSKRTTYAMAKSKRANAQYL